MYRKVVLPILCQYGFKITNTASRFKGSHESKVTGRWYKNDKWYYQFKIRLVNVKSDTLRDYYFVIKNKI